MTEPKLLIELVPMSAWMDNVRSSVSQAEWDKMRKMVYRRAGHVCEICGGKGTDQGRAWPVECHEIWDYNEDTLVQKLVGFIALCPWCHEVKHAGRTISVFQKGRNKVLGQLERVNGWSRRQAEDHLAKAFQSWQLRSKWSWTLDLSSLEVLCEG